MLMKQLKYTHEDGLDHMDYNANPAEDKTIGPWSFDNIDPRQNIWAIVTTSDTGHDQFDSTHAGSRNARPGVGIAFGGSPQRPGGQWLRSAARFAARLRLKPLMFFF